MCPIPLITIQGPTASGKSDLAMALAEALNATIVSADSRQVYRHMDIGTAKPGRDERDRAPHHLIDIVDPEEVYNAGAFARDAGAIIRDRWTQGDITLVVGGTGFYIKALTEGLFESPDIPAPVKQSLRERLDSQGSAPLHRELATVDPLAATRIHPNDSQRILRALEVWHATGTCLSDHWAAQTRDIAWCRFDIQVNPDRHTLYRRIDARVDRMIAAGLVDEITDLLRMGYDWTSPGMNTLGYKEFEACFRGREDVGNAIALMKQHTRNYAKRQMTWLRRLDFDLTFDMSELKFSHVTDRIKEQVNRCAAL